MCQGVTFFLAHFSVYESGPGPRSFLDMFFHYKKWFKAQKTSFDSKISVKTRHTEFYAEKKVTP